MHTLITLFGIWDERESVSYFVIISKNNGASLVAQMVKDLPAMRKTQVQSLGREDPLEEDMATHSSIFAQRIPWTDEPGRLQSIGSQRVGHNQSNLACMHALCGIIHLSFCVRRSKFLMGFSLKLWFFQ